MEMDVNTVVITGLLVRDPITRFIPDSGMQQTDFTVKVLEVGPTGQAFSLFVPCQSWGQVASVVDAMHGGEPTLVHGKLKWHSYTAKDGTKKSSLCVLARLVKRLQPAEVAP